MAITLSTSARNAAADAVVDLIDGGAAAGTVDIYDSGDVLLASLTMSDPAFGSAATGVATADTISSDTSADATGTASYFTCADSDGTEIFRGSVTATGGGGDMELDTVSINSGVTVSVSSLTFTQLAS